MSPVDLSPAPRAEVSSRYRFFRGLLRAWLGLSSRRSWLLRGEAVPPTGAALLMVSHPADYSETLVLVAALERQVRCLVERKLLESFPRRFLAWAFGMIPFEPEGGDLTSGIEAASGALTKGEAVLVFSEKRMTATATGSASIAARVAVQAASHEAGKTGPAIVPVHLFFPPPSLQSGEPLIHVDAPLAWRETVARGGVRDKAEALSAMLEEASRRNAFRLQPEDVQHFLRDLEDALRADLQENWAKRPNWRQETDGFELSQFVREWVERLNVAHPGRLVALRELLDTYREARRRWSLRRFEVEAAGEWMKSGWRRLAAGLESVVGLPLAGYGLVNHLLALPVCQGMGLRKKGSGRARGTRWLIFGLVAAGLYALQILLCARFLGRAAAGYYALSLPLSGAYLCRYARLLERRTQLLLFDAFAVREASRVRRMRKELLKDFNAARDAHIEALGLAH